MARERRRSSKKLIYIVVGALLLAISISIIFRPRSISRIQRALNIVDFPQPMGRAKLMPSPDWVVAVMRRRISERARIYGVIPNFFAEDQLPPGRFFTFAIPSDSSVIHVSYVETDKKLNQKLKAWIANRQSADGMGNCAVISPVGLTPEVECKTPLSTITFLPELELQIVVDKNLRKAGEFIGYIK